ncbi:ubiquitin-protein ligase peroxin 12 [Lobulomyces angularis]|nr:ubiquitin-protein ligase peroxin 12 [Lobulomyces angularis]
MEFLNDFSQNESPSFFELTLSSQLNDLIPQAMQYSLANLTQRYPSLLLKILNKSDEIFDASFSENFYGLKRINNAGTYRLQNFERYASLIELVFFPYLNSKVEQISEQDQHLIINTTSNAQKKRFMKLKLQLKKSLMLYYVIFENFDHLKTILPLTIFIYKFFDWWYKSEFHNKGNNFVIPPPPKPTKEMELSYVENDGLEIPTDSNICPICLDARVNPTVIETGYVFCYSCIYEYIEKYEKCPITLKRATVSKMRRIYQL